ncbi:MAG: hypothetical protein U0235_20305 [Polyangiaceae bacterium]
MSATNAPRKSILDGFEFTSDFAKTNQAIGREDGFGEGWAAARNIVEDAFREARRLTTPEDRRHLIDIGARFAVAHEAIGREQGRIQGRAEFLRMCFEKRGIAVTPEQRALVDACKDIDQLDAWLRKAAVVATADEVFAP